MEAVAGAGQRRDALAAAREVLTDIGSVLWQVGGVELGAGLTEIDDLIRLAEAARVAVVGEALERGEASTYTGPTQTRRPTGTSRSKAAPQTTSERLRRD